MTEFPTLLTQNQLAQKLGMHRTSLWRLLKGGKLHGVRVGQRLRFDPTQVRRQLGLDEAVPAPDTTATP